MDSAGDSVAAPDEDFDSEDRASGDAKTADELFNALTQKFPPREYALLAQVRNCTGFARQVRTADALVMSLWPSRGLELAGIEIKIDRRDWLREKNDPEKAESLGKYCDRWWIVTPPVVVQLDELPPAWGLMEYDKTKEKWMVRKPAMVLKPKDCTREFLAAILRNISETTVPHAAIEDQIKRGIETSESTRTHKMKVLTDEIECLKQRILDFEQASGVSIGTSPWTYHESKELGAAVRQVLNGEHKRLAQRLESLKDTANDIATDINRHLDGLSK